MILQKRIKAQDKKTVTSKSRPFVLQFYLSASADALASK